MNGIEDAEDPRRRLLIQALSAGLFTASLPAASARAAGVVGSTPSKLPAGQSIYRMSGKVLVNGNAAGMATRIGANDTVETAQGGEIVFVVGENAMILRGGSRVELRAEQNESLLISGLRLLTGKLLSVSRNRPMQVTTVVATIGIRGTGFYLESDPQQTYFCTCYGATEVAANDDRESKQSMVSKHHDQPLYILAGAKPGQSIRKAPFINHTDQELMLIETLVGRTPPFVFPGNDYNAPRRSY
jgi:ferric-dicitrate binding protein FerR (iron transport regulator)